MSDQDTTGDAPGTAVAVADDTAGGALVVSGGEVAVGEEFHHHPTPRQYVMIAVVLVVVTSIEIATSYLNTGHTNLIIVALFLMAALKFFLVAAWYMHMRNDQAFFRRIFVVGMVGAGVVYGIVILVFSSTVLKS
jgi:cytochrome c oxidase subunit 4